MSGLSAPGYALTLAVLAASCRTPTATRASISSLGEGVAPASLQTGTSFVRVTQGRPVVAFFFATWCFPCLVEVRTLERLAREHPGLAVVLIGMDREGAEVLRPWVEANGVQVPVFIAESRLLEGATALGTVRQVPTLIAFDSAGMPLEAIVGPQTVPELEARARKWARQ